jgi:hypothetical protein
VHPSVTIHSQKLLVLNRDGKTTEDRLTNGAMTVTTKPLI